MLWLAGLVGMAGVGAAAFVGINTDTSDEDDEMLMDETVRHDDGDGLLLDQIKDHSTTGGLLQSDVTVAFSTPPTAASGDSWGDDVLNEVMAELNTAEAAATAATDAEATYTSAMLDDGDVEVPDADTDVDQLLSDWIAEREGTEILDYEANTESLMVVWDDSDAAAIEPQVDVAPDPDDPEVMHVSMNGENVAEVYGDSALSVADLTLIPLSSAMAVGLEAV